MNIDSVEQQYAGEFNSNVPHVGHNICDWDSRFVLKTQVCIDPGASYENTGFVFTECVTCIYLYSYKSLVTDFPIEDKSQSYE